MTDRFVVCGARPWNRRTFDHSLGGRTGSWEFASTPDELETALASGTAPRLVFFLHWSWVVPAAVFEAHECVLFHMTAVPYGRGGSPLQNLIDRGHDRTMVSAIRMGAELDAGPVYATRELLLYGSAEEVYLRADQASVQMIDEIIESAPVPEPQEGEVVVFQRRHPAQSELPASLPDLNAVHDFVRMLDAETYPRAFIDHGRFRIEFTRSTRYDGRVEVDARITEREADA
jgi:methionyl-tRNA formyltransferase